MLSAGLCTFPGCTKYLDYHGLCRGHVEQQRRGLTLRPLRQRYAGMDPAIRLKKYVRQGHVLGCWEWIGAVQSPGYGCFSLDGERMLAHRASWLLFKGPIPENEGRTFSVLHHCDNKLCVNPEHLFLGTHSDNAVDSYRKGFRGLHVKLTPFVVADIRDSTETAKVLAERYGVHKATIDRIRNGHAWTFLPQDPNRQPRFTRPFTQEEVLTMRRLYKDGHSQSAIASQFGRNPSLVQRIIRRVTWKHLPDEG